MSQSFTLQEGAPLVRAIIDALIDNREYLSDLDGALGDGDHGINLAKGAKIAKRAIERSGSDVTMSEAFTTLGEALVNKVGGSAGPIYGAIFLSFARASQGSDTVDTHVVDAMLTQAREGLQEITSARVGDKPLMDVLVPVAEAVHCASQDGDLGDIGEVIVKVAEEGLESTRALPAKFGRAHRWGDQAVGHLDAGAASCSLVLSTFGRGIISLASK